MGKYDGLSDEELRRLLLKKSPEALEVFRQYDKIDSQLLAFNLCEMDREEEAGDVED